MPDYRLITRWQIAPQNFLARDETALIDDGSDVPASNPRANDLSQGSKRPD
jgi:hypothetical protein